MTHALILALAIVAAVLAAIEQVANHGRSLLCWAVLALSIALLLWALEAS